MSYRIFLITALFFNALFANLKAQPFGCIDSAVVNIHPVDCYGLKTGSFSITEVFGGVGLYYFSIDSSNWFTNKVFNKLKAGKYTLYIKDGNSCVYQTDIDINEPPLLQVHIFSGKDIVKPGETFQLIAEVEPEGTILKNISWRNPDLFPDMQQLEQTVRIYDSTTFYVQITTPDGCTASDIYTQNVTKINYFIPNAFKPGSNLNSFFTVFADEGIQSVVSLEVFDRWGTRVFNNYDFPPNYPEKGWDGRFKNKNAPNGVYFWTATLEFLDGKRTFLKGDVTLSN
jgi:hypothetical protein